MMNFKETLERDLENVFFNTAEFAETVNLYYNGEWREVRAVVESEATEEDYDKLTEAIYNCDGAAQEMAEIRLDNLNGDITIAKSAWEGFAITMGDLANGELRDIVQQITEIINQANKWVQNNPETIKQIAEIVLKLGGVTAGGLAAVYAGQKLQGGFLGVAKAYGKVSSAFKAADVAKEGKKFSAFASAISPLTKGMGLYTGIAAGAVVITAAVAAGIYYLYQEEKKADLAKRFGDISLSLEEIDDIAKQIVWNGTLEQLSEAFNSFKELDNIAGDIKAARDEFDKLNWKVGIGLELTENEQQEYMNSVSNYVNGIQNYVDTQGYSIHVALNALFDESDKLYGDINSASAKVVNATSNKLTALGTELSEYVAEAFSDGIFDIDEQKAAMELQRKMAEIESVVTESKYKAKYDMLEMDMGAAGLTAESAKKLQEQIRELALEGMGISRDTVENTLVELHSQMEQALWLYENSNNPIEKSKNKKLLDEITSAYKEFKNSDFSELYVQPLIDSLEFQFKTLENVFPDFTEIFNSVNDDFNKLNKQYKSGDIEDSEYYNNLKKLFQENSDIYEKFNSAEKSNFNDYLREMETTVSELEKISEGMENVPEGIDSLIKYFDGLKNLKSLYSVSMGIEDVYIGGYGTIDEMVREASEWEKEIAKTVNDYKLKGFKNSRLIKSSDVINVEAAYASGTDYSVRDFIAGENGPELITNAPGMKVYTAEETANLIGSYKQIVMFLPALKTAAGMYSKPAAEEPNVIEPDNDVNVTVNMPSHNFNVPNGLSDEAVRRLNALDEEFADRVREVVKWDYINEKRVSFKK